MDSLTLTCCGEAVEADDIVRCPECGTRFTDIELDEIRQRESTQVPAVDIPRLRSMLNLTSDVIFQRRQELGAVYGIPGFDLVFPIEAIRRFANRNGQEIKPLSVGNGVVWIDKPKPE